MSEENDEVELTDCEARLTDMVLNLHEIDRGVTSQSTSAQQPVEETLLGKARKRQRETEIANGAAAYKRRRKASDTAAGGASSSHEDEDEENYCLGVLYSKGSRTKTEAEGVFRAADRGDPRAQFVLATQMLQTNGRERLQALPWLEKSAAQGFAEAQVTLGEILKEGCEFLGADPARAYALFADAAAQGNAKALFEQGLMSAVGMGVPQNPALAEQHLRKAAGQGLADAQFQLGFMLTRATAASADVAAQTRARERQHEGVQWLGQAAEQGHCKAQTKLGILYFKGVAVAKDNEKAYHWYTKAAEQGFPEAQTNLGLMYTNGHGVAKDTVYGARWLRAAADQGYARAQTTLGLLLSKGIGIRKDETQAARYFEQAAKLGCPLSQAQLGIHFADGRGVEADHEKAVFWLSSAAYKGQQMAIFRLGLELLKKGLVQEGVHMLELPAKAGCAQACTALLEHHAGVSLLITLGCLLLPPKVNKMDAEVVQKVHQYCSKPSNTSKLIMQFAVEPHPLKRLLYLDAIVRYASVPQLHLVFITSGYLHDLERALLGCTRLPPAPPPPPEPHTEDCFEARDLSEDHSVTDLLTPQEVAGCILRNLYKAVHSKERRLKFDCYEEVPFVKQLYNEASSADVEITLTEASRAAAPNGKGGAVAPRRVLAHKLILSQYAHFRELFAKEPATAPNGRCQLEVSDASPEVFQILLKYMYKYNVDDDITVDFNRISDTLAAAKRFRLEGLHCRCVGLVARAMRIDVLQQVYEQATAVDDESLLDVCLEYGMQVLPLIMNRWMVKGGQDANDLTKAAVVLFLVERGCKLVRENILLKQQHLNAAEARQQGAQMDLV